MAMPPMRVRLDVRLVVVAAVVGAAMAVRLDVGLAALGAAPMVVLPVVFELVHGPSCVVVGKQLPTRRVHRVKSSHDSWSAPCKQKKGPRRSAGPPGAAGGSSS